MRTVNPPRNLTSHAGHGAAPPPEANVGRANGLMASCLFRSVRTTTPTLPPRGGGCSTRAGGCLSRGEVKFRGGWILVLKIRSACQLASSNVDPWRWRHRTVQRLKAGYRVQAESICHSHVAVILCSVHALRSGEECGQSRGWRAAGADPHVRAEERWQRWEQSGNPTRRCQS